MKIVWNEEEPALADINKLEQGATFTYNSPTTDKKVWVLADEVRQAEGRDGADEYLCVSLENGLSDWFEADQEVYPVNVELRVLGWDCE